MYQTGQQVLYGGYGVCRITGIEDKSFGKITKQYFALEAIAQPGTNFYVPVDNAAAVAKLRPLMSREALLELLHSDAVRNHPWIADENQRKLRYRELIVSGDRAELLGTIGAIHRHRRIQAAAGRRLHQADENFLNDAQKLLCAEFALVFDLTHQEVKGFILRELENTH